MDKEKALGKSEQLKGKAKQAVGHAVGSKKMENHGKADEAKGRARETVADTKNAAKRVAHKAEDKAANV